MKVENAPSMPSMTFGKTQQSKQPSNFNEHLPEITEVQHNIEISTEPSVPMPFEKTTRLDIGIISQQAAPFLSKDEVNFFENIMQQNFTPRNTKNKGYSMSTPVSNGLNIKA